MKNFKKNGIITKNDKSFVIELINQLCNQVEEQTGKKCYFFSGSKNDNYWMPLVRIGHAINPTKLVWYDEIWYDGVCVFREKSEKQSGEWQSIKFLLFKLFVSAFEWSKTLIAQKL